MTFADKLLIVAMALQALLAVILVVMMGRERVPRVMSGEIAMADIAVERTAYPLKARLLSNSFDNQFQLPVLFYAVALLALIQGGASWLEVAAAMVFVALRYGHAFIHVTRNDVMRRFVVYSAGLAVLCLLWLLVLLRLLLA